MSGTRKHRFARGHRFSSSKGLEEPLIGHYKPPFILEYVRYELRKWG
jgi:hypothetical protein